MHNAPLFQDIAGYPKSGEAFWIHAEDQTRLRIGAFTPSTPCKGTVLVFPGRTEYIEKHGPTVAELARSGFACLVIDWRGHGLSDRLTEDNMISHVDRFSDYHKDVTAMVQAAERLEMPKPWYLMGHSMGGLVGLGAMIRGLKVAACAFTAPLWGIPLSSLERGLAWPLTGGAKFLGKGYRYAPGSKGQRGQCYVLSVGADGNRLTSDPERFQSLVSQARALPNMQTGAPSMGWVFESLKACRSLSKLPSPKVPCLTFCGKLDEVVDIRAMENRMSRWSDGRFELIENAKHDLFSEVPSVREKVISQISEHFHNHAC